jgi:hypothetical protein
LHFGDSTVDAALVAIGYIVHVEDEGMESVFAAIGRRWVRMKQTSSAEKTSEMRMFNSRDPR